MDEWMDDIERGKGDTYKIMVRDGNEVGLELEESYK